MFKLFLAGWVFRFTSAKLEKFKRPGYLGTTHIQVVGMAKRYLSGVKKQYSFVVHWQNSWWIKCQRTYWAIPKAETIPLDGVKRPVWSGIKWANVVCLSKRKKAEIAPAKSHVLWEWIGDSLFSCSGRKGLLVTLKVMISEGDCMHSCLKVKSLQSSEEHSNFTVVMQRTGGLVTCQKWVQ